MKTDKQSNKQTDKQSNKQTDKQTDKQSNKRNRSNRKNCFITTFDGEWKGPVNVLESKLGFEVVKLHAKEYGNFPTRSELLKKEAGYSLKLIANLRKYNHSGIIVCSNYCALVLPLLCKMGLLKCDEILWYGVYLHNPRMFGIVRRYLKFALPKRNNQLGQNRQNNQPGQNKQNDVPAKKKKSCRFKIVVFSRPEIELYADAFQMSPEDFIYMPYGEWNPEHQTPATRDDGYFFAGGYANRDYVSLAKLFQDKPWKLIIAASKANAEFLQYTQDNTLSDNIQVYWDIPEKQFNELLSNCHAMMLIMKYNTGASGQVLLLHALERSKLVIASYTDVVDEYVKNEVNGLILQEKTTEALEKIMDYISKDENREHMDHLAKQGYEHYLNHFSYEAISNYLVNEILKEQEGLAT